MSHKGVLSDRASLNITEAAQYLGVSRALVRKLMTDGELRWFWIGSSRRIIRTSIEEWMKRKADEAKAS